MVSWDLAQCVSIDVDWTRNGTDRNASAKKITLTVLAFADHAQVALAQILEEQHAFAMIKNKYSVSRKLTVYLYQIIATWAMITLILFVSQAIRSKVALVSTTVLPELPLILMETVSAVEATT